MVEVDPQRADVGAVCCGAAAVFELAVSACHADPTVAVGVFGDGG
jgi:hypothetical protein